MRIKDHALSLRLTLAAFLLAVLIPGGILEACTTAVISGKATPDGRPLLWKNRDADDLHNQVVRCTDGRYAYVGVVNQRDAAGLDIWAGINEKGFALMNSATFCLDKGKETQGEGRFMKLALQTCATVEEFQQLLTATNATGRDVAANFGVIDAAGGACYFETGKNSFKRYDANDPACAPDGWIVRANSSLSGNPRKWVGILRGERGNELVQSLCKARRLTARNLLAEISRDTANVRIGSYPADSSKRPATDFAYTGDSLCRWDTASVALFEGVRPGENPLLSTAWFILGQPVTGAACPVWVASGSVPQELAVAPKAAPLNAACDKVRGLLYPDGRADLKKFIRISSLTTVLPNLLRLEAANFDEVEGQLAKWRGISGPLNPATMKEVQDSIARKTLAGMHQFLAGQKAGSAPEKESPSEEDPETSGADD